MNPVENLTLPEMPNQTEMDSVEVQKPYDPIELKKEWYIKLVSDEYKTKFWKDLPLELETLLSKVIIGKTEEERDIILDDVIGAILDWSDTIDKDIKEYLSEVSLNQTEISSEQGKIEMNENKTIRNNSILSLGNSLENLNWTWKNYDWVLKRVKNLKTLVAEKWLNEDFENEINSILTELQNPATLFALSLDLQQQDPKAYETFKTAVIELQPSFEAKFIALEPKLKLALWNDTLTNATITGNSISQTSDKYTTTAKLDWTERTLGRSDSEYKLNSTLKSDKRVQEEVRQVEAELNERIEPITKKLQSLNAIKEYLKTTTTTDITEVKEEVKRFSSELYAELWLDNVDTLADIMRAIETQSNKLTNEKEKMKDKAQEYLKSLTRKHKKELAEKQEIQKKILDFLHDIWFDRISQSVINTIIENINFAPKKYWLQKRIDFENGSLGFDTDFWSRDISEGEKQKFIALFNRMLKWSPDYPVKYANWVITFHTSPEDAKAGIPAGFTFSIWEFINRNLGANPEYRIMRSLEKWENENI